MTISLNGGWHDDPGPLSFLTPSEFPCGEDIENLDEVYTVLDGEPFVRVGVNYRFPFRE